MATQENYINGVQEDGDDDDDDDDQFGYLRLLPEKGSMWDLFRYDVLGDIDNGAQFLESSNQEMVTYVAYELRFGMVVTLLIRKATDLIGKPLNLIGYSTEFLLNLLSQNGNLLGLLYNLTQEKCWIELGFLLAWTTWLYLGYSEPSRRVLGVYTFGQPRIGDFQFGRYIEAHLSYPVPKYFRVICCNDMLPRLPYDIRNCFHKHFGVCLYYDSRYIEHVLEQELNEDFFGTRHLIGHIKNAAWELLRSLRMEDRYGADNSEGWFSFLTRIVGLAFSHAPAHDFSEYINSVRLGKEFRSKVSSF